MNSHIQVQLLRFGQEDQGIDVKINSSNSSTGTNRGRNRVCISCLAVLKVRVYESWADFRLSKSLTALSQGLFNLDCICIQTFSQFRINQVNAMNTFCNFLAGFINLFIWAQRFKGGCRLANTYSWAPGVVSLARKGEGIVSHIFIWYAAQKTFTPCEALTTVNNLRVLSQPIDIRSLL